MSNIFEKEIAFLNRKLGSTKVTWKPLPAVSQLMSEPVNDERAKDIFSQLRDVLGKKAVLTFNKMFCIHRKLNGEARVICNLLPFREVYGSEIDGAGGGGGRGYNPLSTRPSPRGAGV